MRCPRRSCGKAIDESKARAASLAHWDYICGCGQASQWHYEGAKDKTQENQFTSGRPKRCPQGCKHSKKDALFPEIW